MLLHGSPLLRFVYNTEENVTSSACMASFSSLKCCHTCSCSKCYFADENVIACLISYYILCNKSHEFREIMEIKKKHVGVYLFKFRAQQTRFEINVLAV